MYSRGLSLRRRHVLRIARSPVPIHQFPNGFTLLELAMVCVVIAVLLTASIPRFQQTAQRLRIEQTAFSFAQMLRYARERAITEGKQVVWVWNDTNRQAQLYAAESTENRESPGSFLPIEQRFWTTLPTGVEIPVKLDAAQRDVACPELSEDVLVIGCVPFYPDGTSSDVTITIGGTRERQPSYSLRIHEATGQVVLAAGTAPR